MSAHELQAFFTTWEEEAANAGMLLRSLPEGQYDFRPDPKGRSLGELAWHLAELEGYLSLLVAHGGLARGERPPGIERPRTVAELAPGYARVHDEAKARLADLKPGDLDREVPYFDGRRLRIRVLLWDALVHHLIHHRGQLVLLSRLAGGHPPGLYGPNQEETEAFRAKARA